jgi:murein L,D-transpeptidase YafK
MGLGPFSSRRPVWLFAAGLAAVFVLWMAGIALPLVGGYPSVFDWLRDRSISTDTTPPPAKYDRTRLHAELGTKGFELGDETHLRIFKRERVLELWLKRPQGQFVLFKNYPICNFSGELGPKLKEGDHQAPEGFYRVASRQLNPHSRHHLAFNLGFPNAYDRELERTGSALMVHGGCTSVGCFAMTDPQIDEIYAVVEAALHKGQDEVDVAIFPFRLTEQALAAEAHSAWQPFWQNLKQGSDLFEQNGAPPKVAACKGSYIFGDAALQPGCTPITGWV